ncbi:uncharacterized protein TNCV_2941041 [Trichonephila clavipes]|nr:uncharacterized protein TNCV_2941041 [Trichonephila clavipes]
MAPGNHCISGNTYDFRMSWTYRWAVMMPRINTRDDRILLAMALHTIKPAARGSTGFHSAAVQFPRAWHHSKRRRRWVGFKGSTRNGCHEPKCPLTRRLRMFRVDTGTFKEGATCAWMAATDKAVYCTRAFLTMWLSSRRLVCRGRPEPGLRVNDIFQIH